LAAKYLFLGRFEQIKPFWTSHTQFFYIIDNNIEDGTEIQDGFHSKKNVIFFGYYILIISRSIRIKPFWTCHTQFSYIIDKKIKDGTEIQDGVHSEQNVVFFWLPCTYFSADLNK
jgi:hypothetical protein